LMRNETISVESNIEACELLELEYPKKVIYYDHSNVQVKI